MAAIAAIAATAMIAMFSVAMPMRAVADAADQDTVPAGRVLFETCRGCHAIDGYRNAYPDYPVPRIAGQNAGYIESALKAYRAGKRDHPTMQAQASSLSDAEIHAIAVYLEQQKKRS